MFFLVWTIMPFKLISLTITLQVSMLEELKGIDSCLLWKGIKGQSLLNVVLFSQYNI